MDNKNVEFYRELMENTTDEGRGLKQELMYGAEVNRFEGYETCLRFILKQLEELDSLETSPLRRLKVLTRIMTMMGDKEQRWLILNGENPFEDMTYRVKSGVVSFVPKGDEQE